MISDAKMKKRDEIPFGWKIDAKGIFRVNEDEQNIMEKLYELREAGYTMGEITKELKLQLRILKKTRTRK